MALAKSGRARSVIWLALGKRTRTSAGLDVISQRRHKRGWPSIIGSWSAMFDWRSHRRDTSRVGHVFDGKSKWRFSADWITLEWRARRRIFCHRACTNNLSMTNGAKPAAGGVIGRGLGVAEKSPSLFALLLAAQISILQRHPPALLLLFPARK